VADNSSKEIILVSNNVNARIVVFNGELHLDLLKVIFDIKGILQIVFECVVDFYEKRNFISHINEALLMN